MALADYYSRGALAAAQVLSGFDEDRFRSRLEKMPVGVMVEQPSSREGRALADLLVRLLARSYPQLALVGSDGTLDGLEQLAKAVNPAIDLIDEAAVGVVVGQGTSPFETTWYAGAHGWDALVDRSKAQPTGESNNPFGPGIAACLAAANIFRRIFLPDWEQHADDELRFSGWHLDRVNGPTDRRGDQWQLPGDAVLVGLGAIGNAALWALAKAPLVGRLHVVDPQEIELSNMQRYVLTTRADEGRAKIDLAQSLGGQALTVLPHQMPLAQFLAEQGYTWGYFLLGLDTARDRRSAQAALPRWIANAWTQPGDLGVSVHPRFGADGACVACLYLPDERVRSEDELVAETLGVPDLQMDIRMLLYTGGPVERAFLEAVASATLLPVEALLRFEGRSIRDLYVEGFCGGAIIPLSDIGQPPQDLHVPLAHQSALAGLLLAAALVRSAVGGDPPSTEASRVNVLAGVGSSLAQRLRARRDGRCLCDDATYRQVYERKYRSYGGV